MVIQASAGRRLIATNPALAVEAFDAIGESARQAEAEIGRLVDLLDHDLRPADADGIRLIGELVARAGATGLAVSCQFTGSADGLPARASDAAYRVVQESLTNAFKHAPGAPVDIVIDGTSGTSRSACSTGPLSARHRGLNRPAAAAG
jgi:signal transduction histidine kinase